MNFQCENAIIELNKRLHPTDFNSEKFNSAISQMIFHLENIYLVKKITTD